jgi:hypothetical protein
LFLPDHQDVKIRSAFLALLRWPDFWVPGGIRGEPGRAKRFSTHRDGIFINSNRRSSTWMNIAPKTLIGPPERSKKTNCTAGPGWSRMPMRSKFSPRRLMVNAVASWIAFASVALAPAWSQQPPHGTNSAPLNFGMNVEQASQALGVPLSYVRGRPGDELLLAIPNVKGSALSIRSDGLYLQFRKGRLEGWKGDWGLIRP